MLIEYEDLVEQLKEFRQEVIKALALLDVEVEALHKVAVKRQPILLEDLNRIRAEARKLRSKFETHYEQKLPLLDEKR